MNQINFARGINGKPVASQILESVLSEIQNLFGECFFGFPLIATPEGKYFIDATLITTNNGIILFDLVEGNNIDDIVSDRMT